MPSKLLDQVLVACPHCGHRQREARSGFSTICKSCGKHLRLQEILNPVSRGPDRGPERRHITCFDCGTELDVPVSALSTMCKRCGRHVDLQDHIIATAVSKNFRTKGRFVVEPKGYVFNTETTGSEIIVKGRFHGKLTAEQSLTIFSTAEIKGSFKTPHLIIPADNYFRWPERILTGSAEIAGELAGTLQVSGTVWLRSTARWFGDLVAGNVVMEEGAVVVGNLQIGSLLET